MERLLFALSLAALLSGSGGAAAPAGPASASKPVTPEAAPKQAEPEVVITLKTAAEVSASIILLRDVATVEGVQADLVAALEALEVGASALVGRSRIVSLAYVKLRARQVRKDLSAILFAGPSFCTVSRPDQVIRGADIERAACEAVEAANPGAAAQVAFPPADVRAAVGAGELRAQGGRLFGGTSGTVPIQVLVEGREHTTVTVSFRLLRRAPTLVATRDLVVGTILTDADVRVEERPVMPGPLVLSESAAAVGQQVAAPVKGGAVLTGAMIKPAVVVKRGTRVKLVCRGETFTVTAAGEAMQDAARGQSVRVRNLMSLMEMTGVAVGPQTVEVPF